MQSKLFQFLLIFFFAGSVVVLGASELHHRFMKARRGAGDKAAHDLVQIMKNDDDYMHAGIRHQEQEQAAKKNPPPEPTAGTPAPGMLQGVKQEMEHMLTKLVP